MRKTMSLHILLVTVVNNSLSIEIIEDVLSR